MITTLAPSRGGLRTFAKNALIVLCGVVFITICAKIRVPSWPVPMTLHTLAVMAIAVSLSPRLSAMTFFTYLLVGAVGLPVFAGTPERGIGLAYMAGPTGGYLLGYFMASWLTSALARGKGTIGATGAMLAGLGVTYAVGLPWLGFYIPVEQIVPAGFSPFILGDLINIAMVALGLRFVPDRFRKKLGG